LAGELGQLRHPGGRARPWYLLIGASGAGKTTLVAGAGLCAAAGTGVLSGIGATRSCAWWHSDDVLVLDTPGRYTTQDIDPPADRIGWSGIIELLGEVRSIAPPGGILIVISTPDLLGSGTPALVPAIQARVQDIHGILGPATRCHLIVTGLDQLTGFGKFFAGLPRPERAAPWCLPASDATSFPAQFHTEVSRLERRLFERLEAEPSAAGRASLMTFPGSFAALQQPLAILLAACGTAPCSICFTAAAERSFVTDLFKGLVRHGTGPVSRSTAARRLASLTISAFAALTAGFYLWSAWSGGGQRINVMTEAVSNVTRQAATLSLDPVTNADLRPVIPLLDQAAAVAGTADVRPLFGLVRTADPGTAGRQLYRNALHRILLPRLLWRLAAHMRDSGAHPDVLYETTRIYLMLGGAGPMDKDLVREWMRQDWQVQYRRDPALQNALLAHLDALLSAPLPPVPLQADLIAEARQIFARISPAQRAYARIRLSAAARQVPSWRPSDALGPVGLALFSRPSGRPLTDGIPGFYTVNGFHTVLLPALDSAAQTIASEAWVTGQPAAAQTRTMQRDIVRLYEIDYAQTWDALLADLNVTPLKSISQAAQDLYVLAAPQSPLRALLAGIVRQLTLSRPLRGTPPAPLPGETAPPGWEIDRRYAGLRDLVGDGPGAPIGQALRALNDMQQQFAKAAASASGLAVLAGQPDPAPALRTEALRQPEPLARWLTTLAASGASLRSARP
ncbi:MAG TPA: ImcF-related family protein, partial [Rhodopila sp.]|nr:ImcF-related family protein [Rhodopila sp.]